MEWITIVRAVLVFSLIWSGLVLFSRLVRGYRLSWPNVAWFAASVAGTLAAIGWLG